MAFNDPFDAARKFARGATGVAAYDRDGNPLPKAQTDRARRMSDERFGTNLGPPNLLTDPYAPPVGPANLNRMGPMKLQNYGPGTLMNRGPAFTMGEYGPAGAAGAGPMGGGGGGGGFGAAFRSMLPQMAMGQARGPFADPTGGGSGGGMHPLEKAYLIASGVGAVGDIYGSFQEGRARDREQKRAEKDDEERRRKEKEGGRVFGEMFRQAYGT